MNPKYIYYDIYHVEDVAMDQIAKIFTNGRSQEVRLPAAYRFNTN